MLAGDGCRDGPIRAPSAARPRATGHESRSAPLGSGRGRVEFRLKLGDMLAGVLSSYVSRERGSADSSDKFVWHLSCVSHITFGQLV